MKSQSMSAANQRSPYVGKSQAFKDAHKAERGTLVASGKVVQTNYQKAILAGVQDCSNLPEVEINMDFGELM